MWFWSNPFCHYTKTDRILTQLPAGCKSQQMQILIQPTSRNMQYRRAGASGCSAEIPPAPLCQRGEIFLLWLIDFGQCEGSDLSPSPNWARVYTTWTNPHGVSLPPFLKGDGGGFPAGNSEYDRWKSPLAPLYERGGDIPALADSFCAV